MIFNLCKKFREPRSSLTASRRSFDVNYYVFSWYRVYGPHVSVLYAREQSQARLKSIRHYFISEVDYPYKLQPNMNYESLTLSRLFSNTSRQLVLLRLLPRPPSKYRVWSHWYEALLVTRLLAFLTADLHHWVPHFRFYTTRTHRILRRLRSRITRDCRGRGQGNRWNSVEAFLCQKTEKV